MNAYFGGRAEVPVARMKASGKQAAAHAGAPGARDTSGQGFPTAPRRAPDPWTVVRDAEHSAIRAQGPAERNVTHQDVFERVLASLQDAALDDSLWSAASARIDEACGATGNGLVVCEGSGDSAQIVHAGFFSRGRPCEHLQREYVESYYRLDERVPRLRRLPAGRLARVRSLFTEDELKTSPVYNESLRRMGARNGFNVRLDGPDGCHIFWGTADPSGPGDWRPGQIRMMRRLLPHIRHFVCVRRALAGAGVLNASLDGPVTT